MAFSGVPSSEEFKRQMQGGQTGGSTSQSQTQSSDHADMDAALRYMQLPAKPKGLEDFQTSAERQALIQQLSGKSHSRIANTLVYAGLGTTVFALSYGIYQMARGNSWGSQYMMRLRVGAQAFTVFSVVSALMYERFKATSAKKAMRTVAKIAK